MYLGRVVEFAPTEQLFKQAHHPYTQSLLSAVPVPDPAPRAPCGQRIVLQGELPSPDNLPAGCSFHTRCPVARDLCSNEAPGLDLQHGAGHHAACHFPVSGAEDLLAADSSVHGPAEVVHQPIAAHDIGGPVDWQRAGRRANSLRRQVWKRSAGR